MIKVIVDNIGMILAVLSIINVSISFVFIYKNHKIIQEMERKNRRKWERILEEVIFVGILTIIGIILLNFGGLEWCHLN